MTKNLQIFRTSYLNGKDMQKIRAYSQNSLQVFSFESNIESDGGGG